jgi:ABC-2 type transport system permease protein
MNTIWVIARRELSSFFDSLIAYVILAAFLGISGLFTWDPLEKVGGADIFFRRQADLFIFFNIAYITLFFFIPALTMRQIAEEKKTGTIELLLTKAVTDWQLVLGKFTACLLMVGIALLFTLPYYYSVAQLGNIDHGATITGYFGLLLMSAAYIAVGLFASSVTSNQIIAFLLAILIGVFFLFLFDIMANRMSGWTGSFFQGLSFRHHFDSISRGVLDSKDIVFFLSVIVLSLALAERIVGKRG